MPSLKKSHLIPVVAMVDQSIDIAIDFLTNHTKNPEQLMLNVSKEEVLRRLQCWLHAECDADDFDGEKVWCLVNIITATIVAYVMETMSDSISYQFCCEWKRLAFFRKQASPLTVAFPQREYWVYKLWIWEKLSNYLEHLRVLSKKSLRNVYTFHLITFHWLKIISVNPASHSCVG